MTTQSLSRPSRFWLVALAAVVGGLALSMLYVAQAHAGADPITTAQAATSDSWDLVAQYGPLWGGGLLLFGLLGKLLATNESTHWIAQGRWLALLTGAAMTGGAVLDWHFRGAPAAGIAVTIFMAIKLVWSPTVAPAPSTSPSSQAGFARLGLLFVLAFGSAAIGSLVLSSCATPGTKIAAVEHGLWDCTAPARAEVVDALKPLADSALEKVRNPDGTLDDAAFKALFSKANLLSEAGSLVLCAATTAVALLLTPPTNVARAAGPAFASSETYRDDLRAAFEQVRAARFPGVSIKTSAGTY